VKALVEYALRLSDLVEAEGRLAKRHAMGLGLAIVMAATGACFVVLASVCLLVGLFLVLIEAMHPTAALAIISGLFLVLALVGFLLSSRFYRSRAELKAQREGS